MPNPDLDFIHSVHPVYAAQRTGWRLNERRWRAGRAILAELSRFDWEKPDGASFRARLNEATYVNWPDLFLRTMVGHLFKQAPSPDDGLDFGTLGRVQRAPSGGTGDGASTATAAPSRAELVYYNADGAGQDGSAWDPYWTGCLVRAGICGHRWMMVEASTEAPTSRQDEARGRRPFLIDYSPLSIPDWHFTDGQLEYAIVDVWERRPRIEEGRFKAEYELFKYVLVRKGSRAFGPDFEAGGWWMIRAGDKAITDEGDWALTGGEIPMWPLFWERDEGETPETPSEHHASVARAATGRATPDLVLDGPNLSRSAITWLGQIGVSYMNLSSAADFDAWDAAKSTKVVVGATEDAFNLMSAKVSEGSQMVPLPLGPQGEKPEIFDASASAVAAEVFEKRLERKRTEARDLAALEASGTPEASGVSKQTGFADIKSPVLARLASEMETAQNTGIRFLELRFGPTGGSTVRPTGAVKWPRDYQLQPLVEDVREMFELEDLAGASSPTLRARLLVSAAKDKGLLADSTLATKVQTEYEESATAAADARSQARDALNQLGGAGFGG